MFASPAETETTPQERAPYTVSELAFAIKAVVEKHFGRVRLRGEVSGFRGPHASGHCYFALKDDTARIDAIIWRSQYTRLKFKPEEGLEVIATGRISTYPGRSSYQIIIEALEPAGVGALMALLEDRKRRLQAEGLFDAARKRPLPFLPACVGVVTSPTGAVIRDMLHGFTERFPTHVVVWPVRVQGEGCGAEVAAAIRGFNALPENGVVPRPDLIIVARGGGSLEDLWGFNDEAVVRAAADSTIPLISAVGHETDWTLLDLAADARAPTPTKAAEWAVPKQSELVIRVAELSRRLSRGILRNLEHKRSALTALARGLPRLDGIFALPRQRLDRAAGRLGFALQAHLAALRSRYAREGVRFSPRLLRPRLREAEQACHRLAERRERAMHHYLQQRRQKLEMLAKLLHNCSHQSVLARGFALVRKATGEMIRRAENVSPGDALDIEFADGHVSAQALMPGTTAAKASKTGGLSSKSATRKNKKPQKRRKRSPAPTPQDDPQGSLF